LVFRPILIRTRPRQIEVSHAANAMSGSDRPSAGNFDHTPEQLRAVRQSRPAAPHLRVGTPHSARPWATEDMNLWSSLRNTISAISRERKGRWLRKIKGL
jgi:hypothetical protein